MKRMIAFVLVIFFLSVFVAGPAYAGNRSTSVYRSYNYSGGYPPSEKWGYGGKWEEKNSSPSNYLWPAVIGIALIGGLIWLFTKGPSMKQQPQQQVQSQPPAQSNNYTPAPSNMPPWQEQNQVRDVEYNVSTF